MVIRGDDHHKARYSDRGKYFGPIAYEDLTPSIKRNKRRNDERNDMGFGFMRGFGRVMMTEQEIKDREEEVDPNWLGFEWSK